MVISDTIYAMLLTEPFFTRFTKKEIVDAKKSTEVLVALSAESKEAVDDMLAKAIAAGGTVSREPEDYGWMYSKSFEDLDGHIWEVVWMDPKHVQ
jgi:predicted lactoylglutathione lyase